MNRCKFKPVHLNYHPGKGRRRRRRKKGRGLRSCRHIRHALALLFNLGALKPLIFLPTPPHTRPFVLPSSAAPFLRDAINCSRRDVERLRIGGVGCDEGEGGCMPLINCGLPPPSRRCCYECRRCEQGGKGQEMARRRKDEPKRFGGGKTHTHTHTGRREVFGA